MGRKVGIKLKAFLCMMSTLKIRTCDIRDEGGNPAVSACREKEKGTI